MTKTGLLHTEPLLTLRTPLELIPREWLKFVEPKIERQGSCWLWTANVDSKGEPVYTYRNPEKNFARSSRRTKMLVLEMFWKNAKDYHQVIHVCGNTNCLNPRHFYVSSVHWKNEDRAKIIADASLRIQRWNEDAE